MIRLVSWTLCGERDAAILPNTLRAVAPIVDERLVIWTGEDGGASVPDVVDARVRCFLWCDDFAAARNEALRYTAEIAPGEWGIMLDSDERIRCPDPTALRTWLASLPPSVDVVVCYAADGSHGRERIFRLPCPHKWQGRTHETIGGTKANAPRDLILWEERPKTPEQLRAKFERDERLLAAEIEDDPTNPRWHAYRGASLAGLQRFEEAVEEYRAASHLGHTEDSLSSCYRAAEILIHALKRPDQAIAAAVWGMGLDPRWGEFPWIAGVAAMHMGRPDLALGWARIAEVHGARGAGREALMHRVGHRHPEGLDGGPGRIMRAAKAAMSPKDRVRCLIFSKDRPMQLDACLRSLRLHCSDLDAMPVHVIVKASSQEMADAYAELDAATPWATLHPERDFRTEVMYHLDRCEHVLFAVDDTVFVRRFAVGEMVEALVRMPDAIGYSLRLGRNCTWNYPENRRQNVPALDHMGPEPSFHEKWAGDSLQVDPRRGPFSFGWPGADGDFGYPLEVSSSLYRSAQIVQALASHGGAENPNHLEAVLATTAKGGMWATWPRLLCPPTSVAFSIPMNRVQEICANRAGTDESLSPSALLSRWREGWRINVEELSGHTPQACHEEVVFYMQQRPRIEHVERPISITVTSTGFRAAEWAPRCIRSVQSQTFHARHIYVAADQDTLRAARLAERGRGLDAPGIGPTSDDVETSGERLALEAAAARSLGRPVRVFDVGANRGAYTRLALDVIGARAEVYAFEPSDVARQYVKGAVRTYGIALSDAAGSAQVYTSAPGSGMASFYPRAGLDPSWRAETRTIDDVCAEECIAHIDLLKIDVEGHELAVLRGAKRMLGAGAIDAIQFEFGGACVDSRVFLRDFFRLLGDRYDMYRVTPRGLFPVDYSEREEVFVSTNFLALAKRPAPAVHGSNVIDGTGKSLLANLLPVWRSLPDDEVIAWVDGDDWLAHDGAMDIVAEAHRKGALATYGSFVWGDGTPGFAAPADADVRAGMWLTTHLKTFRAGLVKRIREADLRRTDGAYIDLAVDQAIMIPCVEMAGERAQYIQQILYVYNSSHSFFASATEAEKAREAAEARRIRGFRRYDRVTWPL